MNSIESTPRRNLLSGSDSPQELMLQNLNLNPVSVPEEVQVSKNDLIFKEFNMENKIERSHDQKQTMKSIALQKLRFNEKIQKIKELSSLNRYQQLREEDFDLIGDQSFYHSQNISRNKFTSGRIHKARAIKSKSEEFILDPDGLINSILCFFLAVFGFAKFIIAPISFCFPQFCNPDVCRVVQIIDSLAVITFSFQIICGFLTGFKKKNILIENFQDIANNYIKESLFFDLLPIIEIGINTNRDYPILGILYMFRISNCSIYMEKFCNFIHLEENYIAFYHLSRLIVLIVSVAHYNALTFYYISQMGNDQSTWIQDQRLDDSGWQDIYEHALYFIIITMITIGFGDITPVTSRQRIYLIIMTLFSCFLFGYAVNTIGALFQQRDFQGSALKKKKYKILKYLQNRGVSPDISRKVIRQIDYINEMQRNGLFDDQMDDILDKVSTELKQEVQQSISLKILRSCQLINNILSLQCLTEYTKFMKEKTLTPGEILFKKGTRENKIYFINKGEIEIYLQNGNKQEQIILRRIQEKCFLGQMTFLSADPRETSARSVGVTHVIYFEYEDLKRILVNYPDDFEKICMKRDQIQFNLTQTENQMRCYICKRIGHIITGCPRITFKIDSGVVWEQYLNLLKTRQIRNNDLKRRPKEKRHKTFTGLLNMRESLIKYRKTLISMFIEDHDLQQMVDKLNLIDTSDKEFYLSSPKIEVINDIEMVLNEDNQSFYTYCEDLNEQENEEKSEQSEENINEESSQSVSQSSSSPKSSSSNASILDSTPPSSDAKKIITHGSFQKSDREISIDNHSDQKDEIITNNGQKQFPTNNQKSIDSFEDQVLQQVPISKIHTFQDYKHKVGTPSDQKKHSKQIENDHQKEDSKEREMQITSLFDINNEQENKQEITINDYFNQKPNQVQSKESFNNFEENVPLQRGSFREGSKTQMFGRMKSIFFKETDSQARRKMNANEASQQPNHINHNKGKQIDLDGKAYTNSGEQLHNLDQSDQEIQNQNFHLDHMRDYQYYFSMDNITQILKLNFNSLQRKKKASTQSNDMPVKQKKLIKSSVKKQSNDFKSDMKLIEIYEK